MNREHDFPHWLFIAQRTTLRGKVNPAAASIFILGLLGGSDAPAADTTASGPSSPAGVEETAGPAGAVSRLILSGNADAAIAFCARDGNDHWLPELANLVMRAKNVRTGMTYQKCIAQIGTPTALLLLADQFGHAGGAVAAPALIARPLAQAYPILKKHAQAPGADARSPDLYITMAHMPESKSLRIADLKAALADARDDREKLDQKIGAMLGLAYLDDPTGLQAMHEVLTGQEAQTKQILLKEVFRFPSVQKRNLVALLLGRLNDTDGMEQVASDAVDPAERFALTRDWAAILLVRILGLKPSFSIEPVDGSKRGRHLTEAQIREIEQDAQVRRPF